MGSEHLLTINTHKGLFHYTRMPYGVTSAPPLFQAMIEYILKDIPNASCYLDDVLIGGVDKKEDKKNTQ